MVTSIDWKYIEIILNKVEDGKKHYSEREFSYDHYLLIIQYVCVNDLKFQHSRSERISFHASTFAMKSEAEKCWAHEKSERHAEFACACISIMKNNNNNAQAGFQLIKTCKVRYYSRSFVTNVLQCENVIKFVCATPSICIFIAIPNVYLYIFARWHKTLLIEFDRLDFCLFGIGKDSSARLLSGNQSDWYVRQINQYGNHLAVK